MGIDITQLKQLVVVPTLAALELTGAAAVNLVTGTALAESGAEFLHQTDGTALGLWQVEEATEADCWANFIDGDPQLASRVRALIPPGATWPNLIGNLQYGAAICRLVYRRSPLALPAAGDAAGMAAYWKRVYNTKLGAGVADAAHVALFQQGIAA